MLHKQNAPSLKAESVACHLGGDSDVFSTSNLSAQCNASLRFLPPIVSQHWFRDSDLLEALS